MSVKRIFLGLFLAFAAFSGIADAETIFVVNMDGAQNVPANNSAAKGFGVVVLNDDETEIHHIAEVSGLGSNSTNAAMIKVAPLGQNSDVFIGFISWSGGGTVNTSFEGIQKVTPEEVQQLRNGLWYFTVPSVNFPNGEIRGQVFPYSPFAAQLNGAQVVPPNNSKASGRALLALNKTGTQAAIWFGYQNVKAFNVAGFVDAGMPGTNGAAQFAFLADGNSSADFSLRFLRPPQVGITPNEAALLKSGQLYLRVVDQENQSGAGEIRGQIKPLNKNFDFDGDNRADISVFRHTSAVWYWLDSAGGEFNARQWGVTGFDDKLVPADFDGDGLTDIAVWRQSEGTFYVLRSSDGAVRIQQWGVGLTDKPHPADYDGDGKADFAVYRKGATSSAQSVFWIFGSNDNAVKVIAWGLGSDFSIPGDFDGDRTEDLTVVRNQGGQFVYYTRLSSNGELKAQVWGNTSQHYALSGDFDGDGKADPIAFTFGSIGSPTVGNWWILGSSSGVSVIKWGDAIDDSFVPADYDGDGKIDLAVFRSDGWYIRQSSNNLPFYIRFGLGSDVPVTRFPF